MEYMKNISTHEFFSWDWQPFLTDSTLPKGTPILRTIEVCKNDVISYIDIDFWHIVQIGLNIIQSNPNAVAEILMDNNNNQEFSTYISEMS